MPDGEAGGAMIIAVADHGDYDGGVAGRPPLNKRVRRRKDQAAAETAARGGSCGHGCRNKHWCGHKCCKVGLEPIGTTVSERGEGRMGIATSGDAARGPIVGKMISKGMAPSARRPDPLVVATMHVDKNISWQLSRDQSPDSSSEAEYHRVVTEGGRVDEVLRRFVRVIAPRHSHRVGVEYL